MLANQLTIDFDTMTQEHAALLAEKIERFINESAPEVRLHGTCSGYNLASAEHEVSMRYEDRGMCKEMFPGGRECNLPRNHDGDCYPFKERDFGLRVGIARFTKECSE